MPNRRVGSLVYQYLPVINGVPALLIPNGTGRGATRNRVCFYNGIILTVNISPPFHLRWRAYGNRACTTQARPPGVRGKPTILIFASNHARASTRFSLSLFSLSLLQLCQTSPEVRIPRGGGRWTDVCSDVGKDKEGRTCHASRIGKQADRSSASDPRF